MARKAIALLLLSSLVCAQEPQPAKVQVEGRLVDLQGKAIAGADVRWRRMDVEANDGCELQRAADAQTDAEGRYRMPVGETQSLLLRFTARGCCTAQYDHFLRATSEVQGNTRVPTIALTPAVRLIGRVRGLDGKPIPGARVTARDLAPSALLLQDFAVTDDQGIFQLTGVPASPVELRVEAEGRAPVRLLPIDRSSPLDVRMEKAGSCSGALLSADGKPVEGHVYLSYEDGSVVSFADAPRPGWRFMVEEPASPAHDCLWIVTDNEAKEYRLFFMTDESTESMFDIPGKE